MELLGTAQVGKRESLGEGAGIPHFEAVGEEHNLDAAIAVVVAVGDCVDNSLSNDISGNLVFHWSLRALLAGAYTDVDLGHDEIDGLIDEFEGGALVNLVGWNGLGNLGAVEVGALHFGREAEALGVFAEEKDGCVGGAAVVEQIQVREDIRDLGLDGEREIASLAGTSHEAGDIFLVEIVERGLVRGAGVPRSAGEVAGGFEMIDETGVNVGQKVGGFLETAAHELATDLADEGLHLRMLGIIRHAFDEDQAGFSEPGGLVVFEVSGRQAVPAFPAVVVTEETEVEITVPDFIEIDGVGATVGGRDIAFEEESLEETPQQRIT